jgi:two-component system, OmpR family, sensor histidine kinase KdpD
LLDACVGQVGLTLERAQLADEAQRSELRAETEEMRSSLLSSVSHDLRTPIGAALGAVTTLLDTEVELSSDQRLELMLTIREETARLDRIVTNLLDMTRIESGALDMKKDWVPIDELVGGALTRLSARLEARPLEIHVPADLPLARVDPVLMEQLLVNLLENAAKHTPEGSAIEILASAYDGAITLEVADRGKGIEPGTEVRIFEKFVRGGTSSHGVGLGLAICRGIANAHGGTIRASNREGGGASFVISLPPEAQPPEVPEEVDE